MCQSPSFFLRRISNMPSTWRSSSTLLVGEEGEGLSVSSIRLVVTLALSTVSFSTSYATQRNTRLWPFLAESARAGLGYSLAALPNFPIKPTMLKNDGKLQVFRAFITHKFCMWYKSSVIIFSVPNIPVQQVQKKEEWASYVTWQQYICRPSQN